MSLNLTDAIQRQYDALNKQNTGGQPRPAAPSLEARQKQFLGALQQTPQTLRAPMPFAAAKDLPLGTFTSAPPPETPKPPQPFAPPPISDATARAQKTFPAMDSRLAGLAGVGVATVEQMGKALGGAWGKTKGDEVGAVPFDTFVGGVPGIGLPVKALEAIAPQTKKALSTPLRDIPGVGAVVRAGEALGGVANAGYETIGEPVAVATAINREITPKPVKDIIKSPMIQAASPLAQLVSSLWGQDNPGLFEAAGSSKEEAEPLMRGLFAGTNTFEQNKRLEQIVRGGAASEAEANPVPHTILSAAADPLTYADVANVLPMLSNIQEMRRVWQAGGDVTKAREITGATNPLNELIVKAFQPASVAEDVIKSRKALRIGEPQDTTALKRTIDAFRKTPVAQVTETVQRAASNLMPYLNDIGRPLDDKVRLLNLVHEAARTEKITPELQAAMKQWGIANSEDFHRVLRSIGNYDPAPVVARYQRAQSIRESLEQTTRTATPGFNPQVSEFALSEAENLGGGYKDVFTRVIDGWKEGKLDLDQMREGIEKVAGIQLSADVTAHMGATLAKIAKIQPPNPITNIVNGIRRYEGLLFVGANPASMVQNVVNDMTTVIRKGGTLRTEAQADEFLARMGLRYDDNLGNAIRKEVGAPIDDRGAYGSTAPHWTRKIPILKQVGKAFETTQRGGRKAAFATGVERQMNRFVAPALPPKVKAWLGADAARIERALTKSRNAREVEDILAKNVKTWAHYTDEIADELKRMFSQVAGRDVPITAQQASGALPLHSQQNINRVLRRAQELAQQGVNPPDAWEIARKDVYGDDLFGDAAATRLYHGERGSSGTSGEWFTTDPKKAAKYGAVSYVDVTPDEMRSFAQGHGGADEFVTDNPIFRDRAKPLGDTAASVPTGPKPSQPPSAPEIPLTQPKPAQAPQAKPVEGVVSGNIVDTASPAVADATPVVSEQPAGAPAGVVETPKPNIIEQVKSRAAQITRPKIRRDLIREWAALFHEGAPENEMRAISRSIEKWSDDVLLEKAQSYVTRARESGQVWVNQMADMFEERAHYVIEQMAAGNPKYNTPEYMERVANGDALTRMLRGGQNGFDWTKFEQPYDYKPYESFAQYRKRVTAAAIERDFGSGSQLQRPAGDTSPVAPSAGTGSAAGASGQVGGVGGGGDVKASPAAVAPAPKAQGTGIDVPPTSEGGATLDAGDETLANLTWRRTQAKYLDENEPLGGWGYVRKGGKRDITRNQAIAQHKTYVKEALAEGKPVPPEVLADYPDLARNVPPASEGGATLDAGEPTLDPLAQLNAARFQALAEQMRQAGAGSVMDSELNKQTLDAMEQALLDRLATEFGADAVKQANVMPADVQQEMNAYQKQFMAALNNELVKAQAVGRFFQDQTVLNYDGAWNIETALLLERPFVHWWLHSALNYTRDFIDHPAMLAFALHLSDNLQKESERLIAEGKLPERYRGSFKLELPVELPGLGDTLWINPMRLLFPFEDVLQLNALQRAKYSDGEGDLGGVINDVFGVHVPIKLAWNALAQDWDEFQNTFATIPLNRQLKAFSGGLGVEGKYDKFYNERAMKELVATGEITEEDAKVAMLTRAGEAWTKIQQRANAENYTAKEGSAMFGMRGKVYTPGEQKYNESMRAKEQMLDNAVRQLGGNPNMDDAQRYEFLSSKGFYGSPDWLQFKEQHPETNLGGFLGAANAPQPEGATGFPDRLPEDKVQQERARQYYLDAIQEKYYSVPELKQKLIAEDLGDQFKTLFRNKGTKDWDKIPLRTILGWANALDVLLQDPVAGTQMPQPEPFRVTFTTDDQNKRYQAMYDEVAQSFGWGQYSEGWDKYWTLKKQNPAQAKAFLNSPQGKKLLAVSDTVDEFFKENPDIQNLLEKVGLRKPTSANTTPTQGQALTQAMTAAGLNWDTINAKKEEYNKLPKGTGARSKYLAQNPDLLRYFQLSGAIYNTDEELQQNNQSRAPKLPTFHYNPKNTYYGKSYGAPNEKKPTRIYLNMRSVGGGQQRPPQPPYVPRRVTPGGY